MKKQKEKRTKSKYQLKLARRRNLANKIGKSGFYKITQGKNAGKIIPKSIIELKSAITQGD